MGLGFRDLGFRVWGLGFGVEGVAQQGNLGVRLWNYASERPHGLNPKPLNPKPQTPKHLNL